MALVAFLILELPVQWNYEHQITDAGDWHRLDSINAEVLIIGNSRVESGFDATEIEAQTGLKTYCLVQTGWQSRLTEKKARELPPSQSASKIPRSSKATLYTSELALIGTPSPPFSNSFFSTERTCTRR